MGSMQGNIEAVPFCCAPFGTSFLLQIIAQLLIYCDELARKAVGASEDGQSADLQPACDPRELDVTELSLPSGVVGWVV